APGILTVAETARLLEAASRDVLPYIAIGAFAGLRRAELERLDWKRIDFESGLIEVTARSSKTAQRRLVAMQPNLREWLLPLRKHSGNVTPARNVFVDAFAQARTQAGITDWPENALRHSFASYHLAHFKNAGDTALQLGHRDSRVTFAHYRELVKPKDAEGYWQIKPSASASAGKIVSMRAYPQAPSPDWRAALCVSLGLLRAHAGGYLGLWSEAGLNPLHFFLSARLKPCAFHNPP